MQCLTLNAANLNSLLVVGFLALKKWARGIWGQRKWGGAKTPGVYNLRSSFTVVNFHDFWSN